MADIGFLNPMRRTVTVLSKEGCHLCDEVIEALGSLSSLHDFEVKVLDIQEDTKLHDEYCHRIPVVRINGKDIFDARDMARTAGYMQSLERLVKS